MTPQDCKFSANSDAPRVVTWGDSHANSWCPAEAAAAMCAQAHFMETRKYLRDETCPLIQGDVLVYRDSHHLTATFAKLAAPIFETSIKSH